MDPYPSGSLPGAAACAVSGFWFWGGSQFPRAEVSAHPASSFTVYTNNSIYKVEYWKS